MDRMMKYCSQCGSPSMALSIPTGDNRPRQICRSCQMVFYTNPNVVCGAVVTFQDQFLLCKRNIEPRKGYWTYPAGFLEENETVEEGARRETLEESKAKVALTRLIGVYSLTYVNQVHLIYHGKMSSANFDITEESSEVKLVSKEDIPWKELAFPVIRWALKAYLAPDMAGKIDSRSTHLSLQDSLLHD